MDRCTDKDIICVSETWLEQQPRSSFFNFKFDGHTIYSEATRDSTKGTAKRGLFITYPNNLQIETLYKNENLIFVKANYECYEIIIGSVYLYPICDINMSLSDISEKIYDVSMRYPGSCLKIGGDFNCKIGNLNQLEKEVIGNNTYILNNRSSLLSEENIRGKKLVKCFEMNGLFVLNGRSVSDLPAQCTFLNRNGTSVIDLAWISTLSLQIVKDFEVMKVTTGSDLFPIVITLCDNVNIKNKTVLFHLIIFGKMKKS